MTAVNIYIDSFASNLEKLSRYITDKLSVFLVVAKTFVFVL